MSNMIFPVQVTADGDGYSAALETIAGAVRGFGDTAPEAIHEAVSSALPDPDVFCDQRARRLQHLRAALETFGAPDEESHLNKLLDSENAQRVDARHLHRFVTVEHHAKSDLQHMANCASLEDVRDGLAHQPGSETDTWQLIAVLDLDTGLRVPFEIAMRFAT